MPSRATRWQIAERLLGGVQRLDQARAGADAGHHGVEELHVERRHEARGVLTHDTGGGGAAALARQGREGGRAGRFVVERLLVEVRAVLDLDATRRTDALAKRAGIAAVTAVALLHQVEKAAAFGLAHQLAALEVDPLQHFVERRALGLDADGYAAAVGRGLSLGVTVAVIHGPHLSLRAR